MDLSVILENLDSVIAIVGVLIGLGGGVAAWIGKLKIKPILDGLRDLVDLVASYGEYDDDKNWTDAEYKEFGQKSVKVIKTIEPIVNKLRKK